MDYRLVKESSYALAALSEDTRNAALAAIKDALLANKERIFESNKADLERAEKENLAMPLYSRLKFDDHKLSDVVNGTQDLIAMPDPLFKTLLKRELDEGLVLTRETCPIGVIGIIFESRPDALVQISTLCIKSGNCSILKGGSEAKETNRTLYEIIKEAGIGAGLPEHFITLVESREGVGEMLKCHGDIDLIIPRGSNEFVQYIMENSKIPVMGHADGICHIYVDKDADMQKAIPLIMDSKLQYIAVCNAAETLLVHKDAVGILKPLAEAAGGKLELRGCERTREYIDCAAADEADFATEYLDAIISVKIVDDIKEAVDHINRYGSHHTDLIITENDEAAKLFMANVDSAGVYRNCSTRFADGFRYGFGAEVGVSTGKLHARGPVGLEGLLTYKYKLVGEGHIVGDYASGKKKFHFKDL